DAAVRVVLDWAKKRDDTLVLVTADHETGGFGFSYAGRPLPTPVTLEGDAMQGAKYAPFFNYAPPDILELLYKQEKSFFSMMLEFDGLPPKEQTPERLVELVNASSAAK